MRRKIPSFLVLVSFLAFIFFWTVRIVKLFLIIRTGLLPDFYLYYQGVVNLVSQKPDLAFIASRSYGPPFVLMPFLPFVFLPFFYAEVATLLINIISYFLVFFLLWKLYFKKTKPLFWAMLALMSFSFPAVYSLGMGNPIGLVTLGIYSFWIFRKKFAKAFFFVISVLLKIYPVFIVPALFLGKSKIKDARLAAASLFLGFGLSLMVLPQGIWREYIRYLQKIVLDTRGAIDLAIYNQSFSSSLARLGLEAKFLSIENVLFIVFLAALLIVYFGLMQKKLVKDQLEMAVALICFSLLVHPFPWQYYFASLLPFLMIKIAQKNILFILPFLLISFDGNRLGGHSIVKSFLDSSQFFSTLIIFFLITLKPVLSYLQKEVKNI